MPLLIYLVTTFGIIGIFFWVLLDLLVFHQERGERLGGWLASLISWTNEKIEKVSVAQTIQGRVDTFIGNVNGEVNGLLPYGLKIKWMNPGADKNTFIQEGRVVVMLSYHQNQDENIARASLMYMNQAVIPEARLHIGNKLGRAIDLMMTKKALYSFFEERSSFNYFVQSVLRPESENDTDMKSFCAVIEDMDERGLFTRVMLRELLELGYKRAGTTESGDTVFEVGKFINFLDVIVHKSPGEDVPLTFIDKNIRMSIILVARQDTNTLGPDRFVRRIQSQIERYSSEVIYIFAMGQRDIALAKQVMEICETLPNIQRLHAGDFMFRGTNRDIPCFCGIFHSSKVVG